MIKFNDIYPRANPIPTDLTMDFEFNHADGEDFETFAKRRYVEMKEENRKMFSELCNMDMMLSQRDRKISMMADEIEIVKKVYGSLRELGKLMENV